MNDQDFARFHAALTAFDALRDSDRVHHEVVDRIQPAYSSVWPEGLDPSVSDAIFQTGITSLYGHQATAITKAINGAHVVLESPTASGKTLAFTAPMLHTLKANPGSHAMMIYPMKALAFDQREQIRQLSAPLSIESWHYDGDTDGSDPQDNQQAWSQEGRGIKAQLRKRPPHILLTNPEYLHLSFLGNREAWDKSPEGARFLRDLRFVVIDEMHEYRGFFGSNMALLLRRFFLHLHRIGAHPQVFLSTATCANPKEHAEALTGLNVEVVSAKGIFRPKRHFLFVDSDISDYRYRDIIQLRVENAALAALEQGLQVLVFCPTKRFLEDAFRNVYRRAHDNGLDPTQVTAFHADRKSVDRQRIQEEIRAGRIRVVFATNALEIGLDVGGLDGVILAGFPPSIMSAWQQIGRAGRSWDKNAFVLFYPMNDPIDRFVVANMAAFLKKPFDELVVDPANEELITRHIPSLIEEAGEVAPTEEEVLGSAFFQASQGNVTIPAGYKPQRHVNLRGGIGQSFALKKSNEELGQITGLRRFREAYIGAVFPFVGQRYHVRSHEEQAVILEDCEPYLRTDPAFFTSITRADVFDGLGYGDDIAVYYGALDILMNFTGYKLVDDRSGDVLKSGGDYSALSLNNLHTFWMDLSSNPGAAEGIGALEHMFRVGALFVIPSGRFDSSTHSSKSNIPVTTYFYENYPGGIGVAKKLFSVWQVALEKGLEIAQSCRCSSGCQNCIEPAKSWDISNADIDKVKGIALAKELLSIASSGPYRQWRGGAMWPIGRP